VSTSPISPADRPFEAMTLTKWLIVGIAAIGFAFDIYELLVFPPIARPALAELLGVNPDTDSGFKAILQWQAYILYASALSGGIFGLLGGYLTDRLGRRRVLTWSILLYAFSALASGFVTSPLALLIFRCTTFIGVCVEFVAAVAWLSELFPNPRQRETVLGYTQAFSSIGGLLVTVMFGAINYYANSLPEIHGGHASWRYTLISGVIPALPLIIIRPFLPESPLWREKKAAGTLKRPSFGELFRPEFARTTLVTTLLFACGYGAAFGALQVTPQIVPGLDPDLPRLARLRTEYESALEDPAQTARAGELKTQINDLQRKQNLLVADVQFWQEVGGLLGRFVLAWLALRIVSRRALLRAFQLPGLVILPLVYFFPAAGKLPQYNLEMLRVGIFLAGFCTVAQFSFWGNYLPRVYPVYLRGTGEGFAANVGGRMFGTVFNPLTTAVLTPVVLQYVSGIPRTTALSYAAGIIGLLVFGVGLILSAFLPEPRPETDE
jgi:MFS family permease